MNRRAVDPNERATEKPVVIPTVLAVSCPDGLLARCWDALAGMGVMVRDCDPESLATLVATRQPLAIVMPAEVHAIDPDEFDALARDVRAALVKVDHDATAHELEAVLGVAIRSSLRRREGRSPSPSGRYSILPGELLAPVSGRSSAPPSFVRSDPPTAFVQTSPLVLDALEEELLATLR